MKTLILEVGPLVIQDPAIAQARMEKKGGGGQPSSRQARSWSGTGFSTCPPTSSRNSMVPWGRFEVAFALPWAWGGWM